MAGREHATIDGHQRVVVVTVCRFHGADQVLDAGAAVINEALTGIREAVDQIVDSAEETVQDDVGTLD